jgi:glycosyltransferase involved in cell wall biosynthesis
MRILIVCDFLLKYGSQQALSLARAGHEVGLLCRTHALEFGGSTAERDELFDRLRRERVSIFVVPGRVRSMSAVPVMLRIRRELRRWQPDVVNVHENHDPRLLALTAGYPTVLTVHDPLGHPGAPALTRGESWAFRRWFRRADRFVVHGAALVEELAPLVGRERIVVIPHGTTPRSQPLPPPASRCVLLFGRLEPYKGIEVLVAAMRLVWDARQDVRLVVAGEGQAAPLVPEDPRISLIARYIPEEEVATLVAGASIVALPYTQASQSGVGLQALAEGIPVVVSDLGALPELALDPSYVARAGDATALAEAIRRHVDDGIEVRQAVLERARARFSWSEAARATARLYAEVAQERGRRRFVRRRRTAWHEAERRDS